MEGESVHCSTCGPVTGAVSWASTVIRWMLRMDEFLLIVLSCVPPPQPALGLSVLAALVRHEGRLSIDDCAIILGCRSRLVLARALSALHWPPYSCLSGWVQVLRWLHLAEKTGMSLSSIALHRGRDLSTCCRVIQRMTGASWRALLRGGLTKARESFQDAFFEASRTQLRMD
jgi:hypothetical protein